VTGARTDTPVARWLAKTPFFVAHRGGDASWVEGTSDAYLNAAKWNPDLALEVPVWRSADGVWVVSEAPTTGKVFNADYPIISTTWRTLSTLRTKHDNLPMARLKNDILEPYGSTRILFIDNKSDQHVGEFFDLLGSYAGPARYISKGFYRSKQTAMEAHRRGYLTSGYYGTTDMSHFADTQARFDLLGLDYSAPRQDFTEMNATHKPVIAYIIRDQTVGSAAVCNGASGLMVSAVREVVPTLQTNVGQSTAGN
jgi:glycerophosphoryl diester phosphodiesterase